MDGNNNNNVQDQQPIEPPQESNGDNLDFDTSIKE